MRRLRGRTQRRRRCWKPDSGELRRSKAPRCRLPRGQILGKSRSARLLRSRESESPPAIAATRQHGSCTISLAVDVNAWPYTRPYQVSRRRDEFRPTPGSQRANPNQQEDVVTQTRTRINQVNTVIIPIADQNRALEFYVERLGFELRADIPFGNGERWIEVAPAGAETTIALAPPGPGGSTGDRETGIGLQTDDIDAYHSELRADGVDVDAEVSHMGDPVPPLFWLRDPEGNSLMVVG